MQGASWTKVLPKRPVSRWDVFPFGGSNRSSGLAKVTSFFISEFPDYFNAKRLFELFGCSGKVVEVAISPRRTRLGKRFAFARFLDVDDGRILAIRLDNILIEGKKLHVNLPRFNRNQAAGARRIGNSVSKGPMKQFISNVGVSQGFNPGNSWGYHGSYAEVVGKKGQGCVINKEEAIWLNFQSNREVRSRFEKAFVGYVCILGSAYNLQTYLEMEGIYTIKVTPIWGNCCLLEDKEEGFIEELISEGETWWKSWFNSIEKWEAGKVDGRRDVWLRIYGVPLHVWCSNFFVSPGNSWGRFICIDDNTAKGEAFDIARILINIPISLFIPDSVSVCIDGSVVRLCIREDTQGLYRSVGGHQKMPSSEEFSSEPESDRLVFSDSGNSVESIGDDAARFGNKEPLVVVPAEIIREAYSEDLPEEGTRSGDRGPNGIAPKVSGNISVESDCRHADGVIYSVVNKRSEGKTDSVVDVELHPYCRGRKNYYSEKLLSKRDKGDLNSVNKVLSCPAFSIGNCGEEPSVSHRKVHNNLSIVDLKEGRRLCDISVCKSDLEVVVCDVRVPLNLGTVASDSNVVIRLARRGSKVKHRFKKLRTPSGSGIKERSDDSIESFESVSCSKPSISSSAGSEEVKVTAPGDSVLGIESSGNFGLCRDVDSHIFRNSIEAIHGDHYVVVSENGGG